MRVEFLCIVVVGLFWGAYPLLARAGGLSGPLGALILTLCGLVPIGAAVIWQGDYARPSGLALARTGVAGVMMGIGLVAFLIVTNSRRLDASLSIPLMDMAMLIVTVVAAVAFLGEPLTARKLTGIALLLAGIVVLKPE